MFVWSCSAVLIIKCCCRQFVGLMGTFSFHFKYGRHSVYVKYGNEKSGILYGQVYCPTVETTDCFALAGVAEPAILHRAELWRELRSLVVGSLT